MELQVPRDRPGLREPQDRKERRGHKGRQAHKALKASQPPLWCSRREEGLPEAARRQARYESLVAASPPITSLVQCGSTRG